MGRLLIHTLVIISVTCSVCHASSDSDSSQISSSPDSDDTERSHSCSSSSSGDSGRNHIQKLEENRESLEVNLNRRMVRLCEHYNIKDGSAVAESVERQQREMLDMPLKEQQRRLPPVAERDVDSVERLARRAARKAAKHK